MVQPLWKTVWKFLRKLNIELPYDPVIPLLGIYPGKKKFKKIHVRSCCGSAIMNLTSIHEDSGLVLGLTQWVKDPVLL